MSVNRLPLLMFLGALAGGCSSLYLAAEKAPESPLDSDEVTLAAGDEGLKEAVVTGKGSDTVRDEPLDDAIAPELKAAAREAREKLDNPEQKPANAASEQADL
ncbi:MAG: lytic transglycosylase, partial [Marinobacter sp.]